MLSPSSLSCPSVDIVATVLGPGRMRGLSVTILIIVCEGSLGFFSAPGVAQFLSGPGNFPHFRATSSFCCTASGRCFFIPVVSPSVLVKCPLPLSPSEVSSSLRPSFQEGRAVL